MYNPETNELSFPLILHGNTLNGKVHTVNSINGGFKYLADLNLMRNKFYGGNVEKFGIITEYGFYACLHYEIRDKVIGFYIDEPDKITPLGAEMIQSRYPNAKIVYKNVDPKPVVVLTAADIEKKKALVAKALDAGIKASEVTGTTADELDGLIWSMANRDNKKAVVSVEEVKATVDNRPITVVKKVQ